ncbi:Pre-mRNA-splicing factor of RES complex-domain-containing protein, partial [Dunaliella salina]
SGPRMADGTATGLVTGKELQAEMASLQKEMEHKRKTAAGRGAETVYRDPVTGKIVDKETFAESRQRAGKRKPEKTKEELEQEQYLEWRTGLAQKRAAEERAARMVEEANAPFARYEDDSERDALLRQQTRFGDPMANAVRSKRKDGVAASAVTERYNAEKLKSSGFIIPQEIPPHSWIKRGVAAPSNRYDIRPGRHWDGVDRSNGFEREMFKYQNLRRVQEQEARMWSMSDM